MRMLLRLPRWHRASEIFVNINVPTCQALVRNLIFKLMDRLEKSTNLIIRGLAWQIAPQSVVSSTGPIYGHIGMSTLKIVESSFLTIFVKVSITM